jgi:ATP-binding cassette subfamily B protein
MAQNTLKQYKSLLPYLARYRGRYICGLVCLLVVDAAQIAIPQFIRRAVDLISAGSFQWREIVILCAWMIAIMALISLGRFFWRYFIHGSSRRIETEMREKMFAHLQTLSWDFYQRYKTGDLMARAINDLNAVRTAIGMGFVALVDFLVMSTAILAIMFAQDPRSALFSIIPLPLVTALILVFGRSVGKKFMRAQEVYSAMSDTVQETFSGLRVVKSFVRESWFLKKFAQDNDDYRAANMALVRLFGTFFPLVTFLSGFTILLMMAAGGIRVINGLMSPGSLVAMFRYLNMLIWPLMGAGFMVNMIQRGAVSLGRVNEILNSIPSIRDNKAELTVTETARPAALQNVNASALGIKNLTFSYNGAQPALENISLDIKRGEWLGIMGKTGSGKSTLVKVITRMLEPPPGTVAVFGADALELPLAGLRGLFAVSPQDSYLFSDSIQNNIGYGLDSPDEESIENAARQAALEKDMAAFTDGKDTLIGERGLTLSGGQKQRTAIARSLVMDSEFLILDDSLSAVDARTENEILDALLSRRKGRTTIIVSHRVSAVRHADKVLVLEKGRQSEYGSPEELEGAGGWYSSMAALQKLDSNIDNASGFY